MNKNNLIIYSNLIIMKIKIDDDDEISLLTLNFVYLNTHLSLVVYD